MRFSSSFAVSFVIAIWEFCSHLLPHCCERQQVLAFELGRRGQVLGKCLGVEGDIAKKSRGTRRSLSTGGALRSKSSSLLFGLDVLPRATTSSCGKGATASSCRARASPEVLLGRDGEVKIFPDYDPRRFAAEDGYYVLPGSEQGVSEEGVSSAATLLGTYSFGLFRPTVLYYANIT
jgi:hypothetical protein